MPARATARATSAASPRLQGLLRPGAVRLRRRRHDPSLQRGRHFIVPRAARRPSVGAQLNNLCKATGARAVLPFSSFHQYQRDDSIWAQAYTTPFDAFQKGLSPGIEFIPPFSSVDCRTGAVETPPHEELVVGTPRPSTDYGDNWSDQLEAEGRRGDRGLFRAQGGGAEAPRLRHLQGRRPRAHDQDGWPQDPRRHLRGAARQPDDLRRLPHLRRPADRQLHEDDPARAAVAQRSRRASSTTPSPSTATTAAPRPRRRSRRISPNTAAAGASTISSTRSRTSRATSSPASPSRTRRSTG